MPTIKKRKYTKINADRLTDDQLAFLVSGWCLDGMPKERWEVEVPWPGGEKAVDLIPFSSIAMARKAWQQHKLEVLAQVNKEGYREKSWAEGVFEDERS